MTGSAQTGGLPNARARPRVSQGTLRPPAKRGRISDSVLAMLAPPGWAPLRVALGGPADLRSALRSPPARLGRQHRPQLGAPPSLASLAMPAHSSVSAVAGVLQAACVVGVSGSRAAGPGCLRAVTWAVGQLAPGATVATGCASGIDRVARGVPSALVFRAARFGRGRGSFARRSIAVVQRVAGAGSSALWVSAPGRACPRGLVPSPSSSACFAGFGSGSWASLALALGLGVRALVWLPAGVSPPAGWGLSLVCPGRSGAWWGT